ncbi:uncharacterized protein BDZ99DRAFT_458359 [Mytilinidion resinicola]|uniref:Uncharacterized protein n=1 Tax=Mytilinidion resinicola TaxID=574789 RepID=A0A6A6Z8H2_9PEZI|nr:uncharacterized protein BDZ99DRAFT_458359 [Mytilinidion resinicola]KAF2816497.1 hypothetical protein BDZ99DRAFT_458359 [Mytilinidion resinicola]
MFAETPKVVGSSPMLLAFLPAKRLWNVLFFWKIQGMWGVLVLCGGAWRGIV